MAELNLNQIAERLNKEFTGETRKLVFWYDDKGDFSEDIDTIVLENAKVLKLTPTNQFKTKYFLERQDTTTNYLVYAPFPKPDVKDNHLEDTLLYSKRFFADRASLLAVDLGIKEKYKPIIEKYIKFFASKERTQRFYDLEIENFNEENILVGLMSSLCKTRTNSFEEVVRVILTEGELDENKFLEEFDKYDLTASFWKLCEQHFGYTDVKPSLEKLLITLFITYTAHYIHSDVPSAWKPFASYKSGNIIAFLDNLMNSVVYRDKYDEMSRHIAISVNAASELSTLQPDDVIDCDTFIEADKIIVKWIVERLEAEDTGAKLAELSIPEICEKRSKMHFGTRTANTYNILQSAYKIICSADFEPCSSLKAIVKEYDDSDYLIDTEYRKFYYCYDNAENTELFVNLRQLVENIYTNVYLAKLLPAWNKSMDDDEARIVIPLQRNFYSKYISSTKERTVVIISDAMRYEVGKELFKRISDDAKSTATIEPMLSVLPSYTQLGMAALLPHKSISLADDYKVYLDGNCCENNAVRESILQSYCPESCCVAFDSIKNKPKDELREIFTGKDVVYVYHNQIDGRGESKANENEVFNACEEAVTEIAQLISRLNTNANTHNFVITADHGFIYKRDKLTESDKIGGVSDSSSFVERRFVVSKKEVVEDGVKSIKMADVLANDDDKYVSFPISTNVFKAGGGMNYVHGGSSPQEMLVPVIKVKMERGHMETKPVQIALVSIVQKITNLIANMDFIQSEPVNDTNKAAIYKMFFISEDNEKISNEVIYVADSRDKNPQNRIFRAKFTFKNKQYNKNKQYYLVAYDDNTGIEMLRHSVIMDLAFTNDFGF